MQKKNGRIALMGGAVILCGAMVCYACYLLCVACFRSLFFMLLVAFCFEEFELAGNHVSFALSVETADGAVGSNYAMTRNVWSERVAFESLSHGLGAATTDAAGKFTVADGGSCRNLEECEVYAALEGCDALVCQHSLAGFFDSWHSAFGR